MEDIEDDKQAINQKQLQPKCSGKCILLIIITVIGLFVVGTIFFNTSSNKSESIPTGMVAANTNIREIIIEATKFDFNPSEINVKKGERIRLTLKNLEGNHGIGIPTLGISLKGKEGETNSVEFNAEKEGKYSFHCNVFCGTGHNEMKGELIIE